MNISDYFKYSWFSDLAYVDWRTTAVGTAGKPSHAIEDANAAKRIPGNADTSTVDALGDRIFMQPTDGGLGWKLLDYQPNDATGFAASLFGDGNEKVLAIRGTETDGEQMDLDLFQADLQEIGGLGMAISQFVSLFNYIHVLHTAEGAPSLQLKLHRAKEKPPEVNEDALVFGNGEYFWVTGSTDPDREGLGLLSSADRVTVTGHSLGGHLAALAMRVFPDLFDQAATFNAPGNDPHIGLEEGVGLSKLLLNLGITALATNPLDKFGAIENIVTGGAKLTDQFLINMIGEFQAPMVSGFDDPQIAGRLHSLASESEAPGDDHSVASSTLIAGKPASDHVFVTTEANSHSMSQLVDALGVQALLERLSPDIGLTGAGQLVEVASDHGSDSLERLVGSLYRLLIDSSADDPQETVSQGAFYIIDPPTPFEGRGSLHSQLLALEQKLADTPGLSLISLAARNPAELATLAGSDSVEGLAYRYALQQLNPFAVLGPADLYAAHTTDGALNADQFSEQFLTDRARFLSQALAGNRADSHYILESPYSHEAYRDLETGYRFVTGDALQDPHHYSISQWPKEADRLVFGSHAGEEIQGGEHDDHLYGQAGDDILQGNAGDDYLEGGSGNDLYIAHQGDGLDTILDTDGIGRILIDGDTLSGGQRIAEGLWESTDGQHQFAFDGDMETGGTLYIDNRARVENFANGSLGITLTDSLSGPVETPHSLDGGIGSEALWAGQLPDSARVDGRYGDLFATGEQGNDLLTTAEGHDHIDGGDGNDWIVAFDGDDHIHGGDGNDAIFTAAGEDWVDAGAGDDLIVDSHYRLFNTSGNALRDAQIWSDLDGAFFQQVNSILQANDSGEMESFYTLLPPQDLIEGENGETTFVYTPKNGIDGEIVYTSSEDNSDNYLVSHDITPSEDDAPNHFSGGAGDDFIGGNLGDDILLGGPGNDRLTAGAGNDLLLGGSERDILIGAQGADQLDGGTDDDILYGGSGRDHISGGPGNDRLYGDNANPGEGDADTLLGGAGDDRLYGNGGDDRLDGGADDDRLYGEDGRDHLIGSDGDDRLYGGASADYLFGGVGDDQLFGEDGDDHLYGGEGVDRLEGGAGNDWLDGGADGAMDTLLGGPGLDHFIYHPNSGFDLVSDAAADDRIVLQDILLEDVLIDTLQGSDGRSLLALQIDAANALLIADGLTGGPDSYRFADGSELSRIELLSHVLQRPVVHRLDSAGTLSGGRADDTLAGSSGDDHLLGQAGDDVLSGGGGNDRLEGGSGTDRYRFGPGTGLDSIEEIADETTQLELLPGAQIDQLQFHRRGDDLALSLPGDTDQVTLRDFFSLSHSWHLRDQQGNTRALSPESMASEIERVATGQTLAQLREDFSARVEQAFGNALFFSGYQLQADGLWHGESRNGNNVYRRAFGFGVITESVAGNYTRTQRLFDTLESNTRSYWDRGRYEVYQRSSIWAPAGQEASQFVSLEQLAESGASGFRVSGEVIPVHGPGSTYNPLTGQLQPEITGYRVFPNGTGTVSTRNYSIQRSVTESTLQINILDVTLGQGDDRFSLRYSSNQGFNRVDGGAGNDTLDAGGGFGSWYRAPAKLYIPVDEYWPSGNLPGSLLFGNDGDDRLIGSDGADELIGGSGNDYLQGGFGDDSYHLLSLSGTDTIYEDGHTASGNDRLMLPAGITPEDLSFSWDTRLHAHADSGEWGERMTSLHNAFSMHWSQDAGVTLILPHADQQAGNGIETVVFGDGQEIPLTTLFESAGAPPDPNPHHADNTLAGSNFLHGYAGDDTLVAEYSGETTSRGRSTRQQSILIGGAGADRLIGGESDDQLFGNDIVADYSRDMREAIGNLWDAGNEYDGGPGRDMIWATAGNDRFHFELGDGSDRITDALHHDSYISNRDRYGYTDGDPRLNELWYAAQDPAAIEPGHREQLLDNIDTLRFGNGIAPGDITVAPDGDEGLVFAHSNGQDKLTFENWFVSDFNQLGRVEFSDGTTWDRTAIDLLAEGMVPSLLPAPSPETGDRQATTGNNIQALVLSSTEQSELEPDIGASSGQAGPETASTGSVVPTEEDAAISASAPIGNPVGPAADHAPQGPVVDEQQSDEAGTNGSLPYPHAPDPGVTNLFIASTPDDFADVRHRFVGTNEPVISGYQTVPSKPAFDTRELAMRGASNPTAVALERANGIALQWERMQQAMQSLQGTDNASNQNATPVRQGLGAAPIVGPQNKTSGPAITGVDPISLSPAHVNLQSLGGLPSGLQVFGA